MLQLNVANICFVNYDKFASSDICLSSDIILCFATEKSEPWTPKKDKKKLTQKPKFLWSVTKFLNNNE